KFVITLYANDAPITCENFEKLVKEKFYDGLTFHRVVDGFIGTGFTLLVTGLYHGVICHSR
uniref:peptidylprolyl isomerase n=1 Tax=Ruminococcus sp. TaxID=41978 RepID=UPI003A97C867